MQVWRSEGASGAMLASVWSAAAKFNSSTVRLCVGHYVTGGFQNPLNENEGVYRCNDQYSRPLVTIAGFVALHL